MFILQCGAIEVDGVIGFAVCRRKLVHYAAVHTASVLCLLTYLRHLRAGEPQMQLVIHRKSRHHFNGSGRRQTRSGRDVAPKEKIKRFTIGRFTIYD